MSVVNGACSVFSHYLAAHFIKQGVESAASGNQDADAYLIVFKEGSEGEQVPIECLVFAVPFHFKCHSLLQEVNLMGIHMSLNIICEHFCLKFLLSPSQRPKYRR